MSKFINIGHGNMIAAARIVAVVSPESSPIKRLVQDAKEEGRAIDVTAGRRTRAVLVADTGHVILCALQTETITARLNGTADNISDGAVDEEDNDIQTN
ncbi:MAG: DUF370 domain-containing protein [Clostridia bacterium]|nr:DUF370 domain-containing protein [Clostridia bacterium]